MRGRCKVKYVFTVRTIMSLWQVGTGQSLEYNDYLLFIHESVRYIEQVCGKWQIT
jgi:hypothetical protein